MKERLHQSISRLTNGTARRLPLILLVALIMSAVTAQAQTTQFTYQGRLTDGGTAANGNYDMQILLYDAPSGGSQVSPPTVFSGVPVSNGIFSITLGFFNAFTGGDRYLEISVRPAGSGSYTLLTPREQITSTPYAIRSSTAGMADNAAQLGGFAPSSYIQGNDPRLADSRPPTAGSGNYIQNGTSQQSSSNFNVSGNGTVGGTLAAGQVIVTTLGSVGSTTLCRNASSQIATCSSSLRYKTNLARYGRGLEVINRLRPITFDWKEGGMHDVGFGAEDVARIDPLLVTYNDKGQVEGVKYDRISVVLTNAIKQQQTQIETLQARNAALATRLQAVEKLLRKQAVSAGRRQRVARASRPRSLHRMRVFRQMSSRPTTPISEHR